MYINHYYVMGLTLERINGNQNKSLWSCEQMCRMK